jgi:hypothetical protein
MFWNGPFFGELNRHFTVRFEDQQEDVVFEPTSRRLP